MTNHTETRFVYLLRHGHISLLDSERRYIGQVDIPLSGKGIRQARRLQEAFAGKEIAGVFCSDLLRSVQTAAIVGERLAGNFVKLPELRETAMGEWEGKTMSEIAATDPGAYAARGRNFSGYCPPGGESFFDCQKRIVTAFSVITEACHGNLMMIGHASSNRLLLCHFLGIPIDNLFLLGQQYGCVNILRQERGYWRLQLLNSLHACQKGELEGEYER